MRMLVGLPKRPDQSDSWRVQRGSSASGGAPWLRYSTGCRSGREDSVMTSVYIYLNFQPSARGGPLRTSTRHVRETGRGRFDGTGYRLSRCHVHAATNPQHMGAGTEEENVAEGRKLVIVESPAKAKT